MSLSMNQHDLRIDITLVSGVDSIPVAVTLIAALEV